MSLKRSNTGKGLGPGWLDLLGGTSFRQGDESVPGAVAERVQQSRPFREMKPAARGRKLGPEAVIFVASSGGLGLCRWPRIRP